MNWTTITAILALLALETVALLKGVNGAYLSIVITAIAGLGGYQVGKVITARRQDKQPTKKEGAEQP
ncbi:unnamed protein product [marine sediment metagenome]|uniref:Uncharacterized protein n=1 Tax=marine sediment metagenome TaxID=412755 RepID=X1TKR6_9ZZZZ